MTTEYVFGQAEIILRRFPNKKRGGVVKLPEDVIVYDVKYSDVFDPAFGDVLGHIKYMIPLGEIDDSRKKAD